jgi:hypothetical protein
MFCGWRLMFDYPVLEQLGSGTLRIDVLHEQCWHDEAPIPALSIARELNSWLREDSANHSVPFDSISQASITVHFETEQHRGQRKAGSWARPKPVYVGCALSCTSTVISGEDVYTSTFHDHEEWPTPFEVS